MKIVHLLGWYFPDSVGGTEVYVEGLCRRLRAAGHQVLVAAPDSGRAAPAQYEHDGVPVFRYAVGSTPTRDEAVHRVAVRGTEQLQRWLAHEQPDVLHVHSFTTGVGLHEIRAARRLGMRVIATCHLPGLGHMCRAGELMRWGRVPCDGFVEPAKCGACNLTRLGMPGVLAGLAAALPLAVGRVLGRLPGPLGTGLGMSASVDDYQRLQRELFDLVDRFVVLNDTARRMLIANGSPAEKLALNRLGVGQAQPASARARVARATTRPVRFGYLGRIHRTKGLTQLAAAVARIPRSVDFRLAIRGPELDPDSRAFGAALRTQVAGDPRVSFEPAVTADDVPRVLADLDVLVVPSIWFENGPTIALEAMAAGTPVLATRVGNLPEIIEDGVNGCLVDPLDIEGLASALTAVAERPVDTVDAWRTRLLPPRTMDDVARDYLSLYAA